jgi:hypothetical protein
MTVSPARARESPRQGSGNICWEAGLSKACCWRRGHRDRNARAVLPIAEESLLISAIPQQLLIDVSLIREVGRCPRAAVVLRRIVELGRQIVAEGVESRLQLAFLRHLGCQLAQGHFIGRPVREMSA